MRLRSLPSALLASLLAALTIPFLGCDTAGVHAEQAPVMTYSGSNVATTINLENNTVTDEELFSGDGPLGTFTYRELHAELQIPQPSDSCASGPHSPIMTGAGVFRFQDGSLMTVNVTGGQICADLTTGVSTLSETYQITGGTGNLQGASGTLTLTGTLNVVLKDDSGNPRLSSNSGEFKGTILQ